MRTCKISYTCDLCKEFFEGHTTEGVEPLQLIEFPVIVIRPENLGGVPIQEIVTRKLDICKKCKERIFQVVEDSVDGVKYYRFKD